MGGGGVEAGGKGGRKVSEEGECGSYRRAPRHERWAGGAGRGGGGQAPIIICFRLNARARSNFICLARGDASVRVVGPKRNVW